MAGSSSPPSGLLTAFLAVGLVGILGAILALGASLVVPVVEAIVVWFVLNALADGLQRLAPPLPRAVALLLAFVAILLAGGLVVGAVAGGAAGLGGQVAGLAGLVEHLGAFAERSFGIPAETLASRAAEGVGLEAAVRAVVAATAATVAQAGLVSVHVLFLLVDQAFFPDKLRALVPDPVRRARLEALFHRIGGSIRSYLWVMTQVSLLTAGLGYLVMRLVGMEQAAFWAVTIFFLNFIPTVGSILGTVLPVAFAALQFQALGPVLLTLLGIGSVQVVVGNIVLPRMAGKSLNISLFVTIFSLFFWGALWGVTGMFVALPLTAMILLTLAQFEATRPVAVLLSRTGAVEPPA